MVRHVQVSFSRGIFITTHHVGPETLCAKFGGGAMLATASFAGATVRLASDGPRAGAWQPRCPLQHAPRGAATTKFHAVKRARHVPCIPGKVGITWNSSRSAATMALSCIKASVLLKQILLLFCVCPFLKSFFGVCNCVFRLAFLVPVIDQGSF